ncbi:MAG: poly-gamma-glutamate system protein [Calditrichaeota bacterium]|nr:poly-gamma-glutamate system protein [Calditrichota bacterium]
MKRLFCKYWLFPAFIISVLFLTLINQKKETVNGNEYPEMKKASQLAASWFDLIAELKQSRHIRPDNHSSVRYRALIGDDFSLITTTLGSLEAKEIAANPVFAGLIVRLLKKAGIDSASTVALSLTGSFPSLAISALAALQTLGVNTVVLSSLGASCYGANQPLATWIDMETWLRKHGNLRYKTNLLTLGAEDDNGGGLTEEGRQLLIQAAERNNMPLFIPKDLQTAIEYKTRFLSERKIQLLINIGGNQAVLGSCTHAPIIPTGLRRNWTPCADKNRGVLSRLAQNKIPFIHLLNIKELALRYGISKTADETGNFCVNTAQKTSPVWVLSVIIGMAGILLGSKRYKNHLSGLCDK